MIGARLIKKSYKRSVVVFSQFIDTLLYLSSRAGWATLLCPPFLSANGRQTIKLFTHPARLNSPVFLCYFG
jgi:hypothetical protein